MPNPNYIFANTINGNPLYADRAEHDADGNLISTTYATKAELPEGVPTVTSSDDGKVLQASYSGGTGSVSWVTPSAGGSRIVELTVDTSTWADFTAAYAQLTAGTIDGIRAKYAGSGADIYADLVYVVKSPFFGGAITNAYFSVPSYGVNNGVNGKRVNSTLYVLDSSGWTTTAASALASNIVAGTGVSVSTDASYNLEVAVSDPLPAHTSTESGKVLTVNSSGNTVWETPSGGGGSRIVELTVGTSTWSDFTTAYAQLTAGTIDGIRAKVQTGAYGTYDIYADLVYVYKSPFGGILISATFSAPTYSATNGANGKRVSSTLYVLDSNGNWTTTTYGTLASDIVAGAGISVSTDASYNIEVALSTTAGITDIQQVASLPANPVSTVLYLIPET